MEKYGFQKSALIQMLLDVQEKFHWLPRHLLHWIGARLNVPPREIYTIANFYEAFSLEPRGRHLFQVCTGTACHVRGASEMLYAAFRSRWGLSRGRRTASSWLRWRRCIASGAARWRLWCRLTTSITTTQARRSSRRSSSPLRTRRRIHAKSKNSCRSGGPAGWRSWPQRKAKPVWVTVCTGTGCCAYGAEALADGFEKEIEKRGLAHKVGIRRTGCHGFCERGPLVVIQPKGDLLPARARERHSGDRG